MGRYVAMLALLAAGAIHLAIVPRHFFHAEAHGVFFALAGALQVAWVLSYLVEPGRGLVRWAGYALSGGMVVLWMLTHWIDTPFAGSPEPLDAALVGSKIAETVGLIALLVAAGPVSGKMATAAAIAVPVLFAMGWWALALGIETHLPGWFAASNDHGDHDHSEHESAVRYTWQDVVRAVEMRIAAGVAGSEFAWQLPAGFPVPREHPDNPMTLDKVALGRHLFYDQRLSGNETQSCASCHVQALAFTDGLARPAGSTGEDHPRNSPSLVNSAYNAALTWANPALTTLEKQIPVPMFGEHPVELGITGNEAEVLARIQDDALYQRMFALSFPRQANPITYENIVKSLASFLRTMISGDSRYDRFVYGGDREALTASEQNGLRLFLSEELECHHCHGGFNFTHSAVHVQTTFIESPFNNTGLYNIDGSGGYPQENRGLFEHTGNPADMGKFRAPSLRNVAVTAPYMHDGSVATLEEVVGLYEAGGRLIESGELRGDGRTNPHKSGFVPGFSITDRERADLLAFLGALTDKTFLADPSFASPFLGQKETGYRRFLKGIGWFLGTSSGKAVLHHDPIPGYMGIMTMSVEVADGVRLEDLEPGTAVAFEIHFDTRKNWLGHIEVLPAGQVPKAWRPALMVSSERGGDDG